MREKAESMPTFPAILQNMPQKLLMSMPSTWILRKHDNGAVGFLFNKKVEAVC